MPSARPRSFTVTSPRRTAEATGRTAAVQAAKRMSRKTWQPVMVESADQTVTMSFRRGELLDYRHDPRRRRRS